MPTYLWLLPFLTTCFAAAAENYGSASGASSSTTAPGNSSFGTVVIGKSQTLSGNNDGQVIVPSQPLSRPLNTSNPSDNAALQSNVIPFSDVSGNPSASSGVMNSLKNNMNAHVLNLITSRVNSLGLPINGKNMQFDAATIDKLVSDGSEIVNSALNSMNFPVNAAAVNANIANFFKPPGSNSYAGTMNNGGNGTQPDKNGINFNGMIAGGGQLNNVNNAGRISNQNGQNRNFSALPASPGNNNPMKNQLYQPQPQAFSNSPSFPRTTNQQQPAFPNGPYSNQSPPPSYNSIFPPSNNFNQPIISNSPPPSYNSILPSFPDEFNPVQVGNSISGRNNQQPSFRNSSQQAAPRGYPNQQSFISTSPSNAFVTNETQPYPNPIRPSFASDNSFANNSPFPNMPIVNDSGMNASALNDTDSNLVPDNSTRKKPGFMQRLKGRFNAIFTPTTSAPITDANVVNSSSFPVNPSTNTYAKSSSPAPVPASPSTLSEYGNSSNYYFGAISPSGCRSGKGLLIDHTTGSIYCGYWCNNCRHGLGISIIQVSSSNSKPQISAAIWKHSVWQRNVPLDSLSDPVRHQVNSLFSTENVQNRIESLQRLIVLMQDSSFSCPEGAQYPGSIYGTCSPSSFTSPYQQSPSNPALKPPGTPYNQLPGNSSLINPLFQIITPGTCICCNSNSLGSLQPPPRKFANSVIVPVRVMKHLSNAHLQLFSLTPSFHPTMTLYQADPMALQSHSLLPDPRAKELSGAWIRTSLDPSLLYWIEIGIAPNSQPRHSATHQSSVSGHFKLILTEQSLPTQIKGLHTDLAAGPLSLSLSHFETLHDRQSTSKDGSTNAKLIGECYADLAPLFTRASSTTTSSPLSPASITYVYWRRDKPNCHKLFYVAYECDRSSMIGGGGGGDRGSGSDVKVRDVESEGCICIIHVKSRHVNEAMDILCSQ